MQISIYTFYKIIKYDDIKKNMIYEKEQENKIVIWNIILIIANKKYNLGEEKKEKRQYGTSGV